MCYGATLDAAFKVKSGNGFTPVKYMAGDNVFPYATSRRI